MTTMPTEAEPSRPEIDLLLAAALRASQAAVPSAERARQQVTDTLVAWLLALAVVVGIYDVVLLLR